MRLALLGDPVSHSKSPEMHVAALDAAGIVGSYEARRVDAEGIVRACHEVRSGALFGANITMPHKAAARDLADRVSPEAGRAGSVNTWVRVDGEVVGHCTDIEGIRLVWERRQLPRASVLVLGAGGAAAAALVALEGMTLTVSSRRRTAGEALVERVGVYAAVADWGTPLDGVVVVNATPLGMDGENLPAGVLAGAMGVLEMAYGLSDTPAVIHARQAFIPVADGIDLLVAQASESFRLWTGEYPAPGVMEEAARKNSRRVDDGPNHS